MQAERGFLKMLKGLFDIDVPNDENAIEALIEAEIYVIGDCDQVAAQLRDFHNAAGGFGTLLIVTGKDGADRARRERSMRLFIDNVAPQLRNLSPSA